MLIKGEFVFQRGGGREFERREMRKKEKNRQTDRQKIRTYHNFFSFDNQINQRQSRFSKVIFKAKSEDQRYFFINNISLLNFINS